MEIKYILLLGLIVFSGFVSADVISINSGGGLGIVINPNLLIEGFFSQTNNLPIMSNVVLFSTFGTNLTTENLTVTYSSTDEDGDVITNISDWRVEGISLTVLNMPFDTSENSVTSGKIRDYSTYENNGTLGEGNSINAPVWNSSCQVGGCYDFDGVNDYIDVGDSDSLDLLNDWTLAAWINRDSINSQHSIIEKYDWVSGKGGYLMRVTSGNKLIAYTTNGATADSCGATITSISKNTWYYVVATFNADNDTLICYVNSISESSNFAATKISLSGLKSLKIGARGNDGLTNFNGSIDNVQIFNRALSPEQIKIIYEAGLAGYSVESLMSQETNVGETWQVAMTPNDAMEDGATVLSNNLTIVNEAPFDPNPILISEDGSNETTSDLLCSFDIIDPDSDFLNITINWSLNSSDILINNILNIANNTNYEDRLLQGNLTVGDVWECEVEYYDGVDYSNWGTSNNVTIIDVTAPNITIISPLPINYSTLDIDFNLTINENVSLCYYDLDNVGNITMTSLNLTYYYTNNASIGPGPHDVTFWCQDFSLNWGMNQTNFTVNNDAAIAVSMSDNLSDFIRWNVVTLPVNDLDAIGNNLNGSTLYYINISATNTLVDMYVKADGNLFTADLDEIGLGNETYAVSTNDSTVSNSTKAVMTTNYTLIASSLPDNSTIFMKFYLDAQAGQSAGVYLNQLSFKAVREGEII